MIPGGTVHVPDRRLFMMRPEIDARATGTKIWMLREEHGLTVEKLSELLGLAGPRTLYKWRNGEALPTLKNLIVLAEIFRHLLTA